MTIHVLSEVVAAQIAAGEVVERPASVVKELVENALDADASDIRVDTEDGGGRLIRVSDDGAGITIADAALVFARHATSKIQTIDDLQRVRTLGFRGEALHSIGAVSRVTLTTRSAEEATGTQVIVEGGKPASRRSIGVPAGTVVTVEDLFFNTPARLKFLKSATTERRHITTLVTTYAMAYPGVRFSLHHDGREVFRSYGTGTLADVLVMALGTEVFRDMLEVVPLPPLRDDLPPIDVSGYTSAPGQNRADRSHIALFVNGRAVRDSTLAYAVSQAYHTLLPKGRYPVAVLMIALPPEEVDVNVHPTKAEVRFRNPNAVFAAVGRAVHHAVVEQAPAPEMRLGESGHGAAPGWAARRERLAGAGRDRPLELEFAGPGGYGQPQMAVMGPGMLDDDTLAAIPEGPDAPTRPRTLPMLRVLGQVGASYIVAEGPAGLYLIDQHAAHERILYEQFMVERAGRGSIAQQTLDGVTVELPLAAVSLLEEHLPTLAELGLVLEPFGGQMFRVRAVPAILAHGDPAEAVRVVLEDLEAGHRPGETVEEAQIVLHICKAAAVKAGQVLSLEEMRALVRQLERCASPHTCPHGRPTLIHLSAAQLEREFGRT